MFNVILELISENRPKRNLRKVQNKTKRITRKKFHIFCSTKFEFLTFVSFEFPKCIFDVVGYRSLCFARQCPKTLKCVCMDFRFNLVVQSYTFIVFYSIYCLKNIEEKKVFGFYLLLLLYFWFPLSSLPYGRFL